MVWCRSIGKDPSRSQDTPREKREREKTKNIKHEVNDEATKTNDTYEPIVGVPRVNSTGDHVVRSMRRMKCKRAKLMCTRFINIGHNNGAKRTSWWQLDNNFLLARLWLGWMCMIWSLYVINDVLLYFLPLPLSLLGISGIYSHCLLPRLPYHS